MEYEIIENKHVKIKRVKEADVEDREWERMQGVKKTKKSNYRRASDGIGEVENYKITKYPIPADSAFGALAGAGILRDGLVVVGGEASSGKTSFATQLAIDLIRENEKATLAIYTLDDSDILTLKRMYAQLAKEPFDFDSVPKLKTADEKLLERVYTCETFDDIDKLNKVEGEGLLIVILDYLQIVRNTNSDDTRTFFNKLTAQIKDKQKELAKKRGCIFMLLSQLNRATGKKGLARYRETSEVENVADIAVIIDADEVGAERTVKIVKNKLGEKKTYKSSIGEGLVFSKLETVLDSANTAAEQTGSYQGQSTNDDNNDDDNFKRGLK